MVKRYEIRTKIGQGGLGDVFIAYDSHLDREVALKRMRPPAPEGGGIGAGVGESERGSEDGGAGGDLLREAKTLSTLQHPNIVTLYDIGSDDEGFFAVMELIRGETLDATIERGALTLDDFRNVVRQTLEGVIAAHAAGLLHRDIKPSNLMVSWLPSGKFQIKILDFGLAKFSQHPAEQTSDHEDGILGSIYFMAPEQFERLPLDARTDIYSLGCVYYYSLTQRHPFEGESPAQVMASHLRHDVEPLTSLRPDLPPEVCSWVMWLINRAPGDRPASAQEAYDYFRESNAGEASHQTGRVRPVLVTPRGPSSNQSGAGPPPRTAPTLVTAKKPATGPSPLAGRPEPALAPATPPPAPGPTPVTASPNTIPAPPGPVDPNAQTVGGGSAPSAVLTRASAAAVQGPPPGGFPRWALVTLPLCLVAAALGTLLFIQRERQMEMRDREIARLQQEAPPRGNAETVNWLTKYYLEEGGDWGVVAGDILSELEGPGVDEEMVRLLPGLEGDALLNMISAIGIRKYEGAGPALVDIATTSESPSARYAALASLTQVATERDLQPLIVTLPAIRAAQEQEAARAAIVGVLDRRTNDTQRTGQLIRLLARTDDVALKKLLLGMLSELGGRGALAAVTAALDDPEEDVRDAARIALSEWPTSEPAETLFEVARSSDVPVLKTSALIQYAKLVGTTTDRPAEKRVGMLRQALELAEGTDFASRVQQEVFSALPNLPVESAKQLAESFAGDGRFESRIPGTVKFIDDGIARRVTLDGTGGELRAGAAKASGDGIQYQSRGEGQIGDWDDENTGLLWVFTVVESGRYQVSVEQAASGSMGGSYEVFTAGSNLRAEVAVTGGAGEFSEVELGEVTFAEPGVYALELHPTDLTGDELMVLRSVSLRRLGN